MARADAYVRRLVTDRTGVAPADDYRSAALVEVSDVDREHTYDETLSRGPDDWHSVMHNTSEQGDPVDIEQWIGHDEVTTTTTVSGSPQPTVRTPFVSLARSCRGSLCDLGRFIEQVDALFELSPRASAEFVERGTTGPIPIPDGLWTVLRGSLPRHGVINTATTFEITSLRDAASQQVGLVWSDPGRLPILSVTLALSAAPEGRREIAELHRVHHLPGSDAVVQDTRLTFRRVPADVQASGTWSPVGEEEIFDWRFDGLPLHYRASDADVLPDDDDLRSRALAEAALYSAALLDDSRADAESPQLEPSRDVAIALDGGGEGSFTIQPGTILAGTHPIGSMLPLTFVLSNSGSSPVRLGEPRPECGCTRVHLSRHDVPPQGTAVVQAVMEVQHLGSATRSIKVPVDGGGEIELDVHYAGERSAVLRPRFVDLGVVEPNEWPTTLDFEVERPIDGRAVGPLAFDAGDGLRVVRVTPSSTEPTSRASVTLARTDDVYGSHLCDVSVSTGIDRVGLATSRTAVHFETRHPDALEWPPCHVAVDEQRPASLAFPGLRFVSATVASRDAGCPLTAEIDGARRDRVVISMPSGGFPISQAFCRVLLRTSTDDVVQISVFPASEIDAAADAHVDPPQQR
ncbi:MAG: DUF1573 domain-containing protein [Planctomycetes bacterium]|nr:DUF1573 domain-containing protein [Planctomycetota bacterium]